MGERVVDGRSVAVLIDYDRLDARELRHTTVADLLVVLDGHLRLVDRGVVVYEVASFPVVELAHALDRWVASGDGTDFAFDSMSFEEIGAVTVSEGSDGWVFGSTFMPGSTSDPHPWQEVERTVATLVEKVTNDLHALGLDPHLVFPT